jgi:hypothetical protein
MTHGQPQAGDLEEVAHTSAGLASPAHLAHPVLTARPALTVVLMAIVLAGAGASIPAASWNGGAWHAHGIPLGIGLELIFVALLVAAELRRRRWPMAGQPTAGLRTLLRSFLLVGMIAIPVLILIDSVGQIRPGHERTQSPPQRPILPRIRPHAVPAHGGAGGSFGTAILYALIVVVLLAALVGCAILLRRRVRGIVWDDRGEVIDEEPAEQLRRAVESGQAALRGIDDARLAIIACYVAMEGSLARAGAVRAAAETPDELLARAARADLVRGGEAGRLTALFYEARFSSHPLPTAKRHEAEQALEVLAAGLDAKGDTAQTDAAQADTAQATYAAQTDSAHTGTPQATDGAQADRAQAAGRHPGRPSAGAPE